MARRAGGGRRSRRFTVLVVTRVMAVCSIVALASFVAVGSLFGLGVLDGDDHAPMFLVVGTVFVLVGVLVARTVIREGIEPMAEIGEAMGRVATGDFSVSLHRTSHAREIEEMIRSFELMVRELASIETLRTDFVANVSHEFKTPLAAIEGYATLLQSPGLSPEKRADYAAHILHNTRRLSELTSNILLLSRLDNKGIPPAFETFSLDEQLRETILSLEPVWSQRSVELDVDLDEVDCRGNAELWSIAWRNLVGNAVKFAPEGGEVRVTLRRAGAWARVEVQDNGPGMSPEVQAHIFEKFYQGDTSRAAQGNGLGLALVERVVALHDARISVASEPGRGAAFVVLLPLDTKTPRKLEAGERLP